MKNLLVILVLASPLAWGKDYNLVTAKAHYTVKHLVKTVEGESTQLKGKMSCENKKCEFLVAAPVKSFVSSDSNRDLNMQTVIEATRFPLVTVKGNISEEDLTKSKFDVKTTVNFHGVERDYILKVAKDSGHSTGTFALLLGEHKVVRPSLMTVEIENEVPIKVSFDWK